MNGRDHIAQNYKDSLDCVTSIYDFVGKVLKSKTTHSALGQSTDITRSFSYDHAGRLLKTYHRINNQDSILLSENEYNELGQLVTKKLHSEDNGTKFKQHVDFRYNIRGWTTRINHADLNTTDGGPKDFFGMELAYNTMFSGISNTPQFNGNISATKWSANLGLGIAQLGQPTERAYKFEYDPMNRLLSAAHREKLTGWNASSAFFEGNFVYDLNGNIEKLSRRANNGLLMDSLVYTYTGNRLMKVDDKGDITKGFKDGNTTGNDYAYDANGSMTQDLNKDINAISYNYLNLPQKGIKSNGDSIRFVYDATGRKLAQIEYGTTQKHIDYLGEFLYENDTLQSILHEEGRIVPGESSFTYEYHLKDHLGNIRLTFTTKEESNTTTATLETASENEEAGQFLYYEEAVKINSTLFDHTNAGTTYYSARLNGTANEQYGLAKSLSVMPGDTIKAEVYVKYLDTNSSNWTTALTNFMAAIAGGTAPPGTFVDGGATGSTGGTTPLFTGLLNKDDETGNAPKAYLNYLVFDRNYLLLNGGFVRMTENAKEHGQDVAHEKLAAEISITEAGYVYIYISNDNAALGGSTVETYWDDFTIEHIKTPVLQAQNFYPFGLTFGEYTREYALENKWKFQGQEHIKGLGWVSFKWRNHMADIGRFFNVDPLAADYVYNSPYAFSENHVTVHIELEGLEKVYIFDQATNPNNRGSYTANVYVEHDNGTINGPYRGSSYPNSSTRHNTLKESTHQYNNETGHSESRKKGLNIVNSEGSRVAPGTKPNGDDITMTVVNVHAGYEDGNRGSAGCPTIDIPDAEAFFSNFDWSGSITVNHSDGTTLTHDGTTGTSTGTVTVYRGESDQSKQEQSRIDFRQETQRRMMERDFVD